MRTKHISFKTKFSRFSIVTDSYSALNMKYHITIFKPPHPRMNIMDAYLETALSVQWGFNAMAIDCSFKYNQLATDRRNIIFGWAPMISLLGIESIPDDSILYNLEQYSTTDITTSSLSIVCRKFQLWDYNMENVRQWTLANPKYPPFYAPVSYAPVLEVITPGIEDFDITFIGSLGPNRSRKINEISGHASRPQVVAAQNVWGKVRDGLISRSSLMLNISEDNPKLKIFEIVRTSFYLANKKLVLCEESPEVTVEPDVREAFLWATSENLANTAYDIASNPSRYRELREIGYSLFKKRDIRLVIDAWLAHGN
jgi:hypothetical protein